MKPALIALYAALAAVLKVSPAGTAAVVNLAVLAGTRLGLHLTANQAYSIAGAVVIVLGVLVHKTTTPTTPVPLN